MNFALFFTQGTSLKLWEEKGWLEGGSGIQEYNRWADVFETFYFITYGNKEDLLYRSVLKKNIIVLIKALKIPSQIYSFLVPFVYRRQLKSMDIFYSAQMQGAWAAAIAKYLFKKKFILHCGYVWSLGETERMSFFIKMVIYILEWFTCHAADCIIVTAEHSKIYIIKRYRISADKIEIVRNTVNTDLFKPLNLKKLPRSIVYVGRLEREKNPMAVLEAMRGLNMTLIIFGSGSLENKLKSYAADHSIPVIFRGNVDRNQLPEELNKHEIFISPSFYEGSPKALLEAMSCGMPVIGTNVRGTKEIITHKKNGYLCETSPESIREAIMKIEKDEALRRHIGNNARKYILENCQFEKKIQKDIDIFKSVLN